MSELRLGIIGCGNMGSAHLGYINDIDGATVTAVADIDPARRDFAREKAPDVLIHDTGAGLIDSGDVDAVLIATPHYDHPPLTLAAFEKGLHVLVEKPVAVTAKAAAEVNAAYESKYKAKGLVYAAMFQQRTRADWKMVRRMMTDGTIGELVRVSWIITSWFRTQSYYDSGGWRATWEGEGGGVLLNQCPHNLDLFQWFVGMPSRVTANVGIGKFHDIEVEDEVSAILEFENGATGTFVTSTGEAPGANRLEIVGENGTLTVEGGKLVFQELAQELSDYRATCQSGFKKPDTTTFTIEPSGKDGHRFITENFVDAVLNDADLIAPATEGIHGLELGNAMLMSGLTGKPVDIPTDRDAFDDLLKKLVSESTFEKKVDEDAAVADMSSSY